MLVINLELLILPAFNAILVRTMVNTTKNKSANHPILPMLVSPDKSEPSNNAPQIEVRIANFL